MNLDMKFMRSLSRKKSALAELLTDDWLLNWSYLADIFSSLNELNLKLQGRHDNVFLNGKRLLQRPPNGPAGLRGETTTDDPERGGASGVQPTEKGTRQ